MKTIRLTILLVVLLLFVSMETFSFTKADARRLTNEFYTRFEEMLTIVFQRAGAVTDELIDVQDALTECCVNEEVGLPNELKKLHFGSDERFLRLPAYLKLWSDYASDKNIRIKTSITDIVVNSDIKAVKSENSDNFWDVYVKKTIQFPNGETLLFNDMVSIYAPTKKIVGILNESGGIISATTMSLRANAARLYKQKKYEEAYNTYLMVISQDDKDGDAYYRLALLTWFNKGCKNRFAKRKQREQQALDYLDKAIRYAPWDVEQYAKNVKYYIKNGNI